MWLEAYPLVMAREVLLQVGRRVVSLVAQVEALQPGMSLIGVLVGSLPWHCALDDSPLFRSQRETLLQIERHRLTPSLMKSFHHCGESSLTGATWALHLANRLARL